MRILAATDPALRDKVLAFQDELRSAAQAKGEALAGQHDARPVPVPPR